jgi:hypothetical protein
MVERALKLISQRKCNSITVFIRGAKERFWSRETDDDDLTQSNLIQCELFNILEDLKLLFQNKPPLLRSKLTERERER